MSTIKRSVATVAVDRAKDTFGGTLKGMVRLRGFRKGEISEMLEVLQPWASKGVELIVIAREGWDDISKQHLLEEGKSATTYRNTVDACIFFEAEDYSDAQGLRNVTNLTDGNLLGEERTDVAAGVKAFETVWNLHEDTSGDTPETLKAVVSDVLAVHGELGKQLALRQWIEFAHSVSQRCPANEAVDGKRARKAVGRALPSLGMFADSLLEGMSGKVPRQRRLRENRLAADDKTKTGREINRDELAELVDEIEFREPGGAILDDDSLRVLRKNLRGYLLAYQSKGTEGINFSQWLQLFEQTTQRRGVGTKIRDEIEEAAPERLEEYDELDVGSGLDEKEAEAAQTFLDAEADESDQPPLSDLLSTRLKKSVLRIANPTARATEQPLRHLLRLLYAIRDESDSGGVLKLEVRERHGTDSADNLTRALFALLYGPTLESVKGRTEGEGWAFEVEPALLDPSALTEWFNETPHDDETGGAANEDASEWESLRLQLRWEDEKNGTEYFEWRPDELPGFLAFARSLVASSCWHWHTPASGFDEWCEKALESGEPIGGVSTPPEQELVGEWLDVRRATLRSLLREGLRPAEIHEYVKLWSKLLKSAQIDHLPAGAPSNTVSEFLMVDVHRGRDGAPTLLATHPLRLRWVATHLERMADYLVNAWLGNLRLNPSNDGLFFDSLSRISPHEQPSIICDDSHVYVAVRESSWHERYEIVKTRDRTLTDWLSDLDDSSLDEIASALGMYVDAHPFKADGLHLFFAVRQGGARTIHRILDRLSSQRGLTGRRSDMQLTLHVACPTAEYASVSDALEEFVNPEERAHRDFPRIRVLFHDWDEGEMTPPIDAVEQIDVAVVPNLFSSSTRCQEQTQVSTTRRGRFDPLLDRTTIKEAAGAGSGAKNVSRVMLPETADELLESWSTINVRHFRSTKVNQDGAASDIDLITMTVSVVDGEQFFGEIHDKAQWVITLDAFVGREQIEALEHRPKVITVKPELGKGGAYTLVVSSKAGKDFVVHRLQRRLEQQLGTALGVDASLVAEELYERVRELSPGTLLRALGYGRVAQELVGLVVSRNLVAQFEPVKLERSGFESWIALDERPDWFAGGRNSRADLLRVVGKEKGGELSLTFTIVEAKLRTKAGVRKAEKQVESTVELCEAAFAPAESDAAFDDGAVWRRGLIDAIRQSTREVESGRNASFRTRLDGKELTKLPPRFADDIRDGSYTLDEVQGVVCTISDDGIEEDTTTPNGEHRWLRASITEIAGVLERLVEGDELVHDPIPEADSGKDKLAETNLTSVSGPGDANTKVFDASSPQAVGLATPKSEAELARGLSDAEKMARYQQILDAFEEYGVEVMADEEQPVQEGPGFFVFRVRPGHGVTPSTVQGKLDILKLKLGLPTDLKPRSYIDRGAVVFEVPKTDEERYFVAAKDLWGRIESWPQGSLSVAIGEDVTGEPVWIDFSSSNTPHLLIGGITGSGKSVALETILIGLIRHYNPMQLQLSLVDPKGTELQAFEDLPHVDGRIGMYADEAVELLNRMVDEMQRRYDLLREQRVKKLNEYNNAVDEEDRLPWRVVVLDEFADLTSDPEDKRAIEKSLQRLAQKARACGIHVIVATQKPSAEVISTTVRSNLGAQLALRVKTGSDSRIIMDDTGAEALAGLGDAFLKSVKGTTRLQCAKAELAAGIETAGVERVLPEPVS